MQVNSLDIKPISPCIAEIPKSASKRLIDDGMIHYEASIAGLAERYKRGITSHTIHVWWARRPHSAMRALVFASLCYDSSEDYLDILQRIGSTPVPSNSDIGLVHQIFKKQYQEPPRLLDMFAGGGTIPFEACTLGAQTYACDINELSIFIQKCNLEYSQYFDKAKIINALKRSGRRILSQLERETDPLFPLRRNSLIGIDYDSVFGYIWTYSKECTNCGYRFFLSKRPWLSKKHGQRLAIVLKDKGRYQRITLENVPDEWKKPDSTWIGRNGIATCPKCSSRFSNINIKNCNDELIALIKPAESKGKEFLIPAKDAVPAPELLQEMEQKILQELGIILPDAKLPKWSGIVNPALYGIETYSDFLNPRQRILLLLLIKELKEEYHRLCHDGDETLAKCVIGFLSSLIDQVIDWNCRLSMWIPENEQVGRAFSGPGVPMLWDYAETDQLLKGPGNLWLKLERIVDGVRSIPRFKRRAEVQNGIAQKLPYSNKFFDAIVTDPPYYDNIYYSILSDFFYSWKKPLLEIIEPNIFKTTTTSNIHELVASRVRSGSPEKAHLDYCEQFTKALQEAERVLKPDGIFILVYSHGSLQGWEAIIKSYRKTRLIINSAQPLSIERRQRPRAMTSEAKNTCIAFVSRPNEQERKPISMDHLYSELKYCYLPFADALIKSGWNERDAGLAAFTNAVGMLANASCVIENDINDIEALRLLAGTVQKRYTNFSIKGRKSL